MTKRVNQRPHQCRFAGAEVAFDKNHHSRGYRRRQRLSGALGGRLVGQGKNSGNI